MILNNLNLILISASIIIVIAVISTTVSNMVETNFFTLVSEIVNPSSPAAQINQKSGTFICIVFLVTVAVTLYSETYMERYNNNNFYYLLLLFFISIVILSSSSTIVNLIVGWEILGLSSLCLIIFYPNNTSNVNSIITIVFNRIGDVLIILVFSNITLNFVISHSTTNLSIEVCGLLILCSITNSAQFPLSAWLPAAIAAPTPISAIVHSSTLVTAGIFLIISIHNNLLTSEILEMILYFSLLSFLMGGIISNLELDFNNIIAFSTISQISMIIIFATATMLICSIVHMFYHAIFNTLLFCSAGFIFISYWGVQSNFNISINESTNFLNLIIIASIYSITGIVMSASFFTNDLFLENIIYSGSSAMMTITIIAAGIITMFYSINIIEPCNEISNSNTFYINKIFSMLMISIVLLTLLIENFISTLAFNEIAPQVTTNESMAIIFLIMATPLILGHKQAKLNGLAYSFNIEVSHMNFGAYQYWGDLLSHNNFNTTFSSELLFIKNNYISPKNYLIGINSFFVTVIPISIIIISTL